MHPDSPLAPLPEPEKQSNRPTWGEPDLPVLAADFLFITLALSICGWIVFGHIFPRLVG
jgi:hypothetical protein